MLVGSSKQLLDSKFSILIVLSNVCIVPSLAITFTINFLFPFAIPETLIVPSNPELLPLIYPGYTLSTSTLDIPYLIIPKSFSSI